MSTLGFSMSTGAGSLGATPPVADVDIYLDVTAGSDANNGSSWGQAFLTWEKALDTLEKILDTHPTDIHITIYVRNGTAGAVPAGSYCVAPHLSDRVRVHVVQPVDQWETVLDGGLVPIAGSNAEPGSGLAIVTIGGFAPTAAEVGMYLLLTKTVGLLDERILTTILSVDVGNAAYVVSMLDASMPAWVDNTGLTAAAVVNPHTIVNGEFTFAPTGAVVGHGTQMVGGVMSPISWLFGMRADTVIVGGETTGAVGCSASNDAGTFGNFYLTGHGVMAKWEQAVGQTGLSSVRAATWGLVGATPATGQACGNSCDDLTSGFGFLNFWSGYCEGQIDALDNCKIEADLCHAFNYLFRQGANGMLTNFRGTGGQNTPMVLAQDSGTHVVVDAYYLTEGLNPAASILEAALDAEIVLLDGTRARKETVISANYPLIGYHANGGRIEITAGGVPDEIRSQRQLVLAQDGGFFDITGDIDFDTDPRPGAGAADIQVTTGSKMVLRGNIVKDVPNTLACALLDVSFGSQFVQASGAFTHGLAPADWTTSYGNLGLIHVSDHSSATVGQISDGGVGAGANIAIQVRRFSSLWFGANSALTQAGNGLQVGVVAAVFNGGIVQNDLPANPASTEELCVVGPTASP